MKKTSAAMIALIMMTAAACVAYGQGDPPVDPAVVAGEAGALPALPAEEITSTVAAPGEEAVSSEEILRREEEMMEELWMMGLAPALELSNMVTVSRIITQAALTRKESRGTHHVRNYPETDNENWLKHIVFSGSKIRLVNHSG